MAKKGLNMEKVVEIRSEVEEVMENTSVKELELVQEGEMNKMVELKNKVDNGIKYAIMSGKDATDVAKFAPAKQLIGIFKSYKDITGVEMSDTQKDYIKTLNSKQLSNILYTLNIARKTLVA